MGRVVCVTGASGYVASWLVKFLLDHGYTVRATIRDLDDPKRVAHLKALEGAQNRLHLFQADLIEDGSFDSVIDGCDGVFHTAAPVLTSSIDPQTELIEPILKGTLNVLKSCKKATSVKRVVITSSTVTVTYNRDYKGPGVVVDETWFSDKEYCKETERWYWLAKTMGEEAAWKYAEENGMDLVCLQPGFVLGPLLQPTLNTSASLFLGIIKGNTMFSPYEFVDVRDVARAHILAFENPSANGRYILVGTTISHSRAVHILHNLYPSLILPHDGPGEPTFEISKKKAQTLGITFTPLEVSIKDTVESLIERNFLKY